MAHVPGDADTAAELRAVVERVPGWAGRARIVRLLDGGITNRNVLVDVAGERFVLRLAGADTELLEIRRADELAAARRAASLGLAPDVVAVVEPEGYLVTEFVAGESRTGVDLRSPAAIRTVAALLRPFHDGPLLAGDFDAFEVPALHLAAARSRDVPMPDRYMECAAVARRIENAFAATPEPRVPCHNDLLPANFLADPVGRMWLIDWEYAGNNDRYFDLGNLAVNSEFGADEEAVLVEAYFGAVTDRRLARLRLMRIMSDFREAMWGVVQQGISRLEFDYRGYASTHFDRLLAAAASAELDRLLDDAAAGPPDLEVPS